MTLRGKRLSFSQSLPHKMSEWFVFILIILFFAVRDIPVLLYGGQIVAFAGIIWQYKQINRRYCLVWFLFILWVALTGLWASDKDHYLKMVREISQVGLLCVFFYNGCRKEQDIEKILKYITLASFVLFIYFIIKTPLSEWSKAFHSEESVASAMDRFGYSVGYHPNGFGPLCALECSCWLYQWRRYKNKSALLWSILPFILLLFTKSRSAFLFFGIILIVYILFEKNNSKRILRRMAFIAIGVFVALLAILYIQPLYKLFGYRVAGVLAFITGEGKVDASVSGRNLLITAGKGIITDHPLLGVGAGNYSNVAYAGYGTWKDVYAHSNYIELWSDLGLIGILIYYIPRYWCLLRLTKKRKNLGNRHSGMLCCFFIAIMIAELVSDFFRMSYYYEYDQIFFTMCFAYSIMPIERKISRNGSDCG